MARYTGQDVSFDVPEGWVDRSIVAYSAPPPEGKMPGEGASPTVVMTRDELRDGESLRSYVDRQLVEIGRRLRVFRHISSAETAVAGIPALDLAFAWRSESGPIEQRMVVVARGSRIFTFTATVAEGVTPSAASVLQAVLGGIRLAESAQGDADSRGEPPVSVVDARRTVPETAMPDLGWGDGAHENGPDSRAGWVSLESAVYPVTQAVDAPASVPPSSQASPPSSSRWAVAASEDVCDRDGRARAAAAAHLGLDEEAAAALRVRDLHALIPWATRHELVAVAERGDRAAPDSPPRSVVVALGLSEPALFHEGMRAADLSHFFRLENVPLPGGLPAHVLAESIHALLRGRRGLVLSHALLERLRSRMALEEPRAAAPLQKHATSPAVVYDPDSEESWTLTFTSLTPRGGLEQWTVGGDRARLRSYGHEELAPEGTIDLHRWLAPAPPPAVPPPSSHRSAIAPRPPPAVGRGGTRIMPLPPKVPKIR